MTPEEQKAFRQSLYDEAVSYVRKHGFGYFADCPKYVVPDSDCRCHIGALLKDGEYDRKMEGMTEHLALMSSDTAMARLEPAGHVFLEALQRAHDTAAKFDDWKQYEKNLRGLCRTYGLTYTPPAKS